MYQSFDVQSDSTQTRIRIAALRAELRIQGLDGFLVPRADEFQGEYVPPSAERLAWISGFTGSAGLAIILQDSAYLFVDGRYTIQAPGEVDLAYFTVIDSGEVAPTKWLAENFTGKQLGYDGQLHTISAIKRFAGAVEKKNAELVSLNDNPLDAVWTDRPAPPSQPLMLHPVDIAGEDAQSKIARVQDKLTDTAVAALVLNEPDSIAWLLNVRSSDIKHNPVPLCWAIVHAEGPVDLFIAAEKLSDPVRAALSPAVNFKQPDQLDADLTRLAQERQPIQLDPDWMASSVKSLLTELQTPIIELANPCRALKAVKNDAEQRGMRQAHVIDGVAMVKFLHWFDIEGHNTSEIVAAQKLEAFRAEHSDLREISFDTISATGPHGAITHYRVNTKSDRSIDPNSMFLLDSGGQYSCGTTDITRTIATGTPTAEMKKFFTLVLKGHIAVATARFPVGTGGSQLDTLARLALWQSGVDYNHGTGHGVGAYLCVHEGPASISKRPSTALMPGMILSNEPGYYREDHWGIRIENLLLVHDAASINGGEQPMLGFENLTFCPIDLRLIEPELMTGSEIEWLNSYHEQVRDKLTPLLADAETIAWLERATAKLESNATR